MILLAGLASIENKHRPDDEHEDDPAPSIRIGQIAARTGADAADRRCPLKRKSPAGAGLVAASTLTVGPQREALLALEACIRSGTANFPGSSDRPCGDSRSGADRTLGIPSGRCSGPTTSLPYGSWFISFVLRRAPPPVREARPKTCYISATKPEKFRSIRVRNSPPHPPVFPL